ncbi:MAG: hypothetical protein ABL986_19855 [Vicinamibacterales bacterium]
MRIVTGAYNGNVTGAAANGTGAQTYNVLVSGSSSPVGTLVINTRFTATRR